MRQFVWVLIVMMIITSKSLITNITLPFNTLDKTFSFMYPVNFSGKYVSIQFQSLTPLLTKTVLYATFDPTLPIRPQLEDYYSIYNHQNYDLEALGMGKKQIVNLEIIDPTKSTVYVYLFNYDQISVLGSLSVTDGLQDKVCHPCYNSLAVALPNCGCDCSNSFEGFDCSRQIIVLQNAKPKSIWIQQNKMVYVKIKQKNYQVRILINAANLNGDIQVYSSEVEAGKFSNNFHFPKQGIKMILTNGLNTADWAPYLASKDYSITFAKYTPGDTFIQISYKVKERINKKNYFEILFQTIVIIGIMFGGFILIIFICLFKRYCKCRCFRYKTQQSDQHNAVVPMNSRVDKSQQNILVFVDLENRTTQLEQSQVNKFFPQFKISQILEKNNLEINWIKMNECSICLQTIQLKQIARITYFHHIFYSQCLKKWLNKNMNCSLCRSQINKQTIKRKYNQLIQVTKVKELKNLQLINAIVRSKTQMQIAKDQKAIQQTI